MTRIKIFQQFKTARRHAQKLANETDRDYCIWSVGIVYLVAPCYTCFTIAHIIDCDEWLKRP